MPLGADAKKAAAASSGMSAMPIPGEPEGKGMSQSVDSDPQLCYPRKIDQIIRNAIFIAHHIGKPSRVICITINGILFGR